MLKEAETEKQQIFLLYFVIGDISIEWGGAPRALLAPGYAYGALCHTVNPALVSAIRS